MQVEPPVRETNHFRGLEEKAVWDMVVPGELEVFGELSEMPSRRASRAHRDTGETTAVENSCPNIRAVCVLCRSRAVHACSVPFVSPAVHVLCRPCLVPPMSPAIHVSVSLCVTPLVPFVSLVPCRLCHPSSPSHHPCLSVEYRDTV